VTCDDGGQPHVIMVIRVALLTYPHRAGRPPVGTEIAALIELGIQEDPG
jgi:hypothetical protein